MNISRLTKPLAALVAVLVLGTALPPSPAHAQPSPKATEEASSRFKKGVDLYKEGDYRAALVEFKRANELAPNFNVLYNIGQVYFQLQDYVGALSSLERYLSEGGAQIPSSRRADVQKDIDKLKARVARLEIVVNVADAEITIDDVAVGKSPLAKPVLVSAGQRRVTVTKPGYVTQTKLVELAGADAARLSVDLPEPTGAQPTVVAPSAPPPPPPPAVLSAPAPSASDTAAPAPPVEKRSSAPIVVGWTLTGALTAGAVVCGVLALGASSDLQSTRDTLGSTRRELDDAASKTKTLALVTDVLAASAVVAGGVSIYLTARGGSSGAPPTSATASTALRLDVNGAGATLHGTF